MANKKCRDCGTENQENRVVLYTGFDGWPVWICPECDAAKQKKNTEEIAQAQDLSGWDFY